MASIVVNGDTSGAVTLSAPAVAGSSVLTLPAVTDTVAGIAATQTLTNKSIVATQLTGTIAAARLPAGSVLQVVNNTSTSASSSTTTYADTGLTATITPISTSSKILVTVSHNGVSKNTGSASNSVNIQLLRGATVLSIFGKLVGFDNQNQYNVGFYCGIDYLDSPATTSAVTYKTQFANNVASANVEIGANGAISSITLMEIAA